METVFNISISISDVFTFYNMALSHYFFNYLYIQRRTDQI